jgi:peptidyl-prolyl cis-trans isomerase SurA
MKYYYFLFIINFIFPQEMIDGVVVVVGKQPVLHSEILQQSQIIAVSKNIDPLKSPYAFQKIYDITLQNMIDQLVVLDVAEKDTNILVTDDEIDKILNQRIEEFIIQAGSKKNFEKLIGMPLRKIKAEYWNDIKNMLYMEKYKQTIIQHIDISRKEVENFYLVYKDSIPNVPEYFNLSIIDVPFMPSKKTKEKTYMFLDSLKNIINKNTKTFEELAKIHSDDPGSKHNGGFLGFTMRGNLLLEYEEAAYSLNINEISPPVETRFGFHIIKLIDKRGEKISTQHILKSISYSKKDENITYEKIINIKKLTHNDPFVFDSMAIEFQNTHKNLSGKYLQNIIQTLPQVILKELSNIKINSISSPIKKDDGYFLIFLYDHKKEYKPNMKKSWGLIERYALQEKQSRIFNKKIKKLKNITYINTY